MLAVHPFYVSYRLQRIAARSAYLRHVGRWDGWAAKSPTLWLSLTGEQRRGAWAGVEACRGAQLAGQMAVMGAAPSL